MNNQKEVDEIITSGKDIGLLNPLQYALEKKYYDLDMIKILLIHPNSNLASFPAFHLLFERKTHLFFDIAELLISHGADVNNPFQYKHSPLSELIIMTKKTNIINSCIMLKIVLDRIKTINLMIVHGATSDLEIHDYMNRVFYKESKHNLRSECPLKFDELVFELNQASRDSLYRSRVNYMNLLHNLEEANERRANESVATDTHALYIKNFAPGITEFMGKGGRKKSRRNRRMNKSRKRRNP
jgi:hypothetical protein